MTRAQHAARQKMNEAHYEYFWLTRSEKNRRRLRAAVKAMRTAYKWKARKLSFGQSGLVLDETCEHCGAMDDRPVVLVTKPALTSPYGDWVCAACDPRVREHMLPLLLAQVVLGDAEESA